MPSRLTLISHIMCPYVQRAAIVLAEKDVAFERVNIDLDAKPDWFVALSPTGQVPLLKVSGPGGGDVVVFESNVILEYIEETCGGRKMHPADPLSRAQHRAWMEFARGCQMDAWYMLEAADQAGLDSRFAALRAKLGRLEQVLGDGPYFAGAPFSIIDAVYAPMFRYVDLLGDRPDLGLFDGLPKTDRWRAALRERPTVRAAVAPEFAERHIADFIKAGSLLLSPSPGP